MASLAIPFLTTYDPPGTSEGTLDPLGLYQIADQLATRFVPAVRERMQRVRFLTVMAVGALVIEGLDGDPQQPEAPPFLVWEWLVVESMVRALDDDDGIAAMSSTMTWRGIPAASNSAPEELTDSDAKPSLDIRSMSSCHTSRGRR